MPYYKFTCPRIVLHATPIQTKCFEWKARKPFHCIWLNLKCVVYYSSVTWMWTGNLIRRLFKTGIAVVPFGTTKPLQMELFHLRRSGTVPEIGTVIFHLSRTVPVIGTVLFYLPGTVLKSGTVPSLSARNCSEIWNSSVSICAELFRNPKQFPRCRSGTVPKFGTVPCLNYA